MVKGIIAGLMVAVVLTLAGCGGAAPAQQDKQGKNPGAQSTPSKNTAPEGAKQMKQWDKPPAMQIDVNKQYFATLKTNKGDVRIELFPKETPKTVNNFVFLARNNFYDGVKFHRVIKDFMIQGGDPKGNGTGGPGYSFEDELPPKHSYDPGIVAMANSGPNTNGSQFFICTGPNARGLNNPSWAKYNQFGKVVGGMDVVTAIASVKVGPNARGDETSVPLEDVHINSVVIEEK